jgi:hypothetical protein
VSAGIDVERAEFREVSKGVWDVSAPGRGVFARAEIFAGQEQWGVRIQDRAPELDVRDLLRVVARLLVWHVSCSAETVDVVLGRTHDHHTLVRVQGDYV